MSDKKLETFKDLRDAFDVKNNNSLDDLYSLLYDKLEEMKCIDFDYPDKMHEYNDFRLLGSDEFYIFYYNFMNFEECCTWMTFLLRCRHWTEPSGLTKYDLIRQKEFYTLLKRACYVLENGGNEKSLLESLYEIFEQLKEENPDRDVKKHEAAHRFWELNKEEINDDDGQ